MSNSNSSTASGGVGFSGLLAIAFIVLKLCGVIAWSWLWVLSPLWIPLALAIVGLLIYSVFKLPSYLKVKQKQKRVKEIMNATGMNEWAASRKYNEEKGIPIVKSKWQQRYDEITENQKQLRK